MSPWIASIVVLQESRFAFVSLSSDRFSLPSTPTRKPPLTSCDSELSSLSERSEICCVVYSLFYSREDTREDKRREKSES